MKILSILFLDWLVEIVRFVVRLTVYALISLGVLAVAAAFALIHLIPASLFLVFIRPRDR